MKKQNGITLIALIFAVLLLIILAGVTLNIVLGENGLIARTKASEIEAEEKNIYDEIVLLLDLTKSGKININPTIGNIKQKYGEDNVTTDPDTVTDSTTSVIVTVKGSLGTYKYKITNIRVAIYKRRRNIGS